MIKRNTPANPENNPPSPKPPVTQMTSIAANKPTKNAGRTRVRKNLEIGISILRRAICQVAKRSIISNSPKFQRSLTLTHVSTAESNASHPLL